MKAIKMTAVPAILCVTLFSCGNNDNTSQNSNNINIDAITNSTSKDPNAKGDNKCLLEYADKYDQLLTEAMVLQASGFSKEKMKVKYSKVLKNNAHHSVNYNFDNGRKQLRLGLSTPMVLPDNISLNSIKAMSLKMFEDSYRAMTAEEQQHYEAAKKEVLAGNSQEANDAIKNANVDKKTLEKGVEKLDGVFSKVANAYQTVNQLGDAARWNTVTNEMVVLQNGVQFVLVVNISEDNTRNRAVANDLATTILNKCK